MPTKLNNLRFRRFLTAEYSFVLDVCEEWRRCKKVFIDKYLEEGKEKQS